MKIAIYLGWIRHNASGGVESFTRNLLEGFSLLKNSNQYVLICSSDNIDSFRCYEEDKRFRVIDAGFTTINLKKAMFFESFKLDRLVSRIGADICFVPCYRCPLLFSKNIFIVVIHDLQAYHFPKNFGIIRRFWLQKGARRSTQKAKKIITISEFVRKDVISKLDCDPRKVVTILNPILPDVKAENFSITSKEIGIEEGKYFYTISALAKNKNLITLLKVIKKIIADNPMGISSKLVISGIGFNQKDADNIDRKLLMNYINQNNLQKNVIFTGFVSNERRNALIKNSQFFLFPSVFEGFGMPVVEAMVLGARVITTNSTSIPEVSENKAIYVDDYFDENVWLGKMIKHKDDIKVSYDFPNYDPLYVAKRYLEEIESVAIN